MSDPLLEAIVEHHAPQVAAQELTEKHWFYIIEEIGPVHDRLYLISDIQRVTAKHFGLRVHDLISDCRTSREVLPRHIAMYLCRTLTRRSHEMIARWFNRADHSVSIFAYKKISRMLETNKDLVATIEAITGALNG